MYSASRRHPHVIHLAKAPEHREQHGRFAYTKRQLAQSAGAQRLACTWYEIPPGRQAVPHHFHSGVEEAVFVLEGKGAVRIGDERIAIAAGDYVALPAGPGAAHSILNTTDAPLRYLCMSTVDHMDIIVYPDSGKISFAAGLDPMRPAGGQQPWVVKTIQDQPSVDFYDGED